MIFPVLTNNAQDLKKELLLLQLLHFHVTLWLLITDPLFITISAEPADSSFYTLW